MDCAQIRDAFVKGAPLPEHSVQAHLLVCPHCRELYQHDAELGRSLADQAALAAPLPDDLFARIEASVQRETGPRAWLRSRPTRLRFQTVALSVLLVALFGGVLHHRADFADYPGLRLVLLLGGYFVVMLIAVGKELTLTVHRREPIAPWIGALALPFIVAFAPATEASRHAGPEGALNCFAFGALLTLPSAALLWAFDRDERISLRTVGLSGVALGLSANLILELHCPSGNAVHLLLGHASLSLAWLAAWWLARRVSRA